MGGCRKARPLFWHGAVTALSLATSAAQAAPQNLTVSIDGRPAVGVAVSVLVRGARATAQAGARADMGQRDKAFSPTLLVVQTGTAVHFPNFDTVRHHVYSFSPTRTFEIKLYAGTPAAPITFDKAGTATLGCNIHDRMLGYIHVVNTPHFGVTDAQGQLTVDLPPGDHWARVWAPAMGETSPGIELPLRAGTGPISLKLNRP
jgi:plastocyanin